MQAASWNGETGSRPGSIFAQASTAIGQRSRKEQPSRPKQVARHGATDRLERLARPMPCRQRAEQAARVRMGRGRSTSAVGPVSTTVRVEHRDAVADLANHAEVVRDQQHPEPKRSRSYRISSRICFAMVTSSAVVGSSRISSFGSQTSAIAIIARCSMPPDNSCG